MEARHKNVIIVSLLAIVLVMAVGYAAFAQTLTINGSANISSKWEIHLEEGGAQYTKDSTMGTDPVATINVDKGGLTAHFTAEFTSPGDSVTYTIPVVNTGTIDATLQSLNISGTNLSSTPAGNLTGNTVVTSNDGNIRYTVTSPGTAKLVQGSGRATLTIKAEFVNKVEGNKNAYGSNADLTVALTYVQA